jgi:DNA-binding MarR family transcriptional regulator
MSTIVEKLAGIPHSKQSLRFWLRLLSCAVIIEKKLRLLLIAEFNTTLPRFDVLATLERAPDGLSMGELSESLLVSQGNVTGIVSRLIAEGLVARIKNKADRRSFIVKLTPAGRSAFRPMAHRHEEWIDRLLRELSAHEFKSLLAGLNRVKLSIARSGL